MTDPLFQQDAYLRTAAGQVISHTEEGGLVLNQSVFYPTGGGQPGDTGALSWDGGHLSIINTVKGEAGAIVLIPEPDAALPPVGADVSQSLDWDRRMGHMRIHTALHLLSVVLPLPVSGGAIGAEKGRLDFNMPEAPEDKQALEDALNALIARDLEVTERWITDAELDAYWIFTEEPFEFENPEEGTIMTGEGMEFSRDFSSLQAMKTRGILQISESEN